METNTQPETAPSTKSELIEPLGTGMTSDEKIMAWLGNRCNCQETGYWGGCPMHEGGGVAPEFCTDFTKAVYLLAELHDRGIQFFLGSDTDELGVVTGDIRFKIYYPRNTKPINEYAATIAGAVSRGILQLAAVST